MMEGYRKGIITDDRLLDALKRILGLKAKLGLHKKQKNKFYYLSKKLWKNWFN